MPNYDFRCRVCGSTFEAFTSPGPECYPCPRCTGPADKVWLRSPGMAPDFQPYFDTQLGTVVNSRQHREQVARERGLLILGREEFTRGMKTAKEDPEPEFDGTAWRESAEKAWNDLKFGNVEPPGKHESMEQVLKKVGDERGIDSLIVDPTPSGA